MSSPTPIPMSPAFRRRPIAEEIFDALAREILLGERTVGEALPPERELAEHYGVSRLILRQALHRLAAMELVRVRQGGASVVLDPEDSDHPEVGALLLRFCPEDPDQLAALRERQIAGSLGMLILAAHRITPKQVQGLKKILADDADSLGESDFDRIAEPFWTCIAEATANSHFRRETRYWFRVARENASVAQRIHIASPERLTAYREVVKRLEEGAGAVGAYVEIAAQLFSLVERQGKNLVDQP